MNSVLRLRNRMNSRSMFIVRGFAEMATSGWRRAYGSAVTCSPQCGQKRASSCRHCDRARRRKQTAGRQKDGGQKDFSVSHISVNSPFADSRLDFTRRMVRWPHATNSVFAADDSGRDGICRPILRCGCRSSVLVDGSDRARFGDTCACVFAGGVDPDAGNMRAFLLGAFFTTSAPCLMHVAEFEDDWSVPVADVRFHNYGERGVRVTTHIEALAEALATSLGAIRYVLFFYVMAPFVGLGTAVLIRLLVPRRPAGA